MQSVKMTALPTPPSLVITDRKQCPDARAAALFHGGCRFLSVREKDLAPGERRALLIRLAALGREVGATMCVHDDIDAAGALGIALHLPAAGDAARARRTLGDLTLIGQSCHSRAEIRAAAAAGVDYVTIGPAFATASKPGYGPAADLGGMIAGFTLPILALGGIAPATIPELPPGFGGLAVMGAAMATPDPAGWFGALQAAWYDLKRGLG